MNKFFGKLSTAMITLTVMGIVGVAVAADEKEQFKKPSFSQGDYWVYSSSDGEERLEYVGEDDGYHVFMRNGTKQLQDDNLNTKGDTRTDFQFPLYVGKHWSYDFSVERSMASSGLKSGSGQSTVKANCEVKGIEHVETAAGIFQALNITCYETFRVGGQSRTGRTYSYWYAPEVKELVKNTQKDKILKEYKIEK